VVSAGEGLGSVISTLTAALSGTAGMAGDDPAGGALGRGYDNSASALLEAMAASRNGLCCIGDGVRMSAHNYSLAEAMSNIAGHSEPLAVPPSTGCVSAGAAPSAFGAATSAPAGWGWVAKYIGMIWPTGDSARLRAAAVAWGAAGTQFLVNEKFGVVGPLGTVRAQQIPEADAIAAALTDADHGCTAIEHQCATIATQLSTYAGKIDKVHAAILDLLARICDPLTGFKEVWDILTDKDEDEIKKIANDIRTLVDNFTAEVDALRHQITAVLSEATTVVTTMGGMRPRSGISSCTAPRSVGWLTRSDSSARASAKKRADSPRTFGNTARYGLPSTRTARNSRGSSWSTGWRRWSVLAASTPPGSVRRGRISAKK
jgi:hypothetical protein